VAESRRNALFIKGTAPKRVQSRSSFGALKNPQKQAVKSVEEGIPNEKAIVSY